MQTLNWSETMESLTRYASLCENDVIFVRSHSMSLTGKTAVDTNTVS